MLDMGQKIRQLRVQKGMTQEAMGDRLGVSSQAISKWENGTTMPDIQLLPELSVLLGVSIDELFSMSDSRRMERIQNMLEDVRFLPEQEFASAEQFLREKMADPATKAEATLLLAELYNKRASEYRDLALPLAKEALLRNPDTKDAHNAVFDAAQCRAPDWNCANHWQTIAFYQDFVKKHPNNRVNYLWLMDILLQDGRTQEARQALEQMDHVEHTYHYYLYDGLIAKEEGDWSRAIACWDMLVEQYPDQWIAWATRADCMAKICRYDEAIRCYRKAMELQPAPQYTDSPEAIAQIAEIQGDYPTAMEMRQRCIEICQQDWGITEGEVLDLHRREIARLRELQYTNS